MDSNVEIPHRKRGLTFLIISLLLLVLGQTVLRSSLNKIPFLIYWMACFICTMLAVLFSFLDAAGVQRKARQQQRELMEQTIVEIARQKEAKNRSSATRADGQ